MLLSSRNSPQCCDWPCWVTIQLFHTISKFSIYQWIKYGFHKYKYCLISSFTFLLLPPASSDSRGFMLRCLVHSAQPFHPIVLHLIANTCLVSVSTQTLQNISLYLVGLRLAWLGSIEPDCLCIVGPSQKKNNQHRGTVPTCGPNRDRKLLLRLGFYSLFSAGCWGDLPGPKWFEEPSVWVKNRVWPKIKVMVHQLQREYPEAPHVEEANIVCNRI